MDIKTTFEKNVQLDAFLVKAAMTGGAHYMINQAFVFYRSEFPGGPDEVMNRAMWLKKQDQLYVIEVSNAAAKMEVK